MKPSRFDRITKVTAGAISRRRVMRGLGGAVLAAVLRRGYAGGTSFAGIDSQSSPVAGSRRYSSPIFVSPHPIHLGDGKVLFNGKVFAIDPDMSSFFEGTTSAPVIIAGDPYILDPAVIARFVQQATPGAAPGTPVASATSTSPQPPDPSPLAEPPPEEHLESICGVDESQDVEMYDGELEVSSEFVARHQGPVGNIQWNGRKLLDRYEEPGNVVSWRWCSGTLISDDLFLTAGHCFDQCPQRLCSRPPLRCPYPCPPPPQGSAGWEVPKINGTGEPVSRAEIATNMHVDLNFQLDPDGEDREEEAFAIVELVEDQLDDLDYAIVRLEKTPGQRYGITRIAAADPPKKSTICIIGHPAGAPKRIDAGLASDYDDFRIVYADIDTKGGSSGSGILTAPGGPIVGVHTTGGCDNPLRRANHGIRISRLLEASPILKKLAAASKC